MNYNINKRKIIHHNVGIFTNGSNQKDIVLLVQYKNRELGVDNVFINSFDTDDTIIFNNLPQPTNPELQGKGFATGTFQLLKPIGTNTVTKIKEGFYPGRAGFGSLKQLGIGGSGTKGVGQSPMSGAAAYEFNKEFLETRVEEGLKSFTEKRHTDADTEGQQIVNVCINHEYGGSSAGGREKFNLIKRDSHKKLGLDESNIELIIVPDTADTKDWLQTASICFSGIAEISAAATGKFYIISQLASDSEPRIYSVPQGRIIFIANNNDALHKPLSTDRMRQSSLIANFVHLFSSSDFGSQLMKELIDFDDDAETQTINGEPRCGKSLGMSFITLNRERLIRHHVARIEELICNSLMQEKTNDEISALAQVFFRQLRLLEGESFNQHSDTLLKYPHNNGSIKFVSLIARSRQLITQNLNGHSGIEAIKAAKASFQHSTEILQEFIPVIGDNVINRRQELINEFDNRLITIIKNNELGFRTALDFCEIVTVMNTQEKNSISDEIVELEHELEQQHQAVKQFQEELFPQVEGKGLIWRTFNRDYIRQVASNGCNAVANSTEIDLRLQAKQQVLQICDELNKHIAERISELIEMLTIIDNYRVSQKEIVDYEENLDEIYVCPNGHSLITRDNITEYYERALATAVGKEFAEAEKQIVNNSLHVFHSRLENPFDLKENPECFEVLSEVAFDRLKTFINNLNVFDELLRIRNIGSESLRSYLLERAREAEPALRLKDNDIHDNPQHYINIIGIKDGASNPIVTELNTYGTQRHPYTAIDTQDPDSIVLLSLRSTFPVSDMIPFDNWKKAYFETAKGMKEERFHRAMWRRFIPLPGNKLTLSDVRRYLAMAFVIGRVSCRTRTEGTILQYSEFDITRPNEIEGCRIISLGGNIQNILTYFQQHYDLLVEIFSLYYEINYQLKGPEFIDKKLLELQSFDVEDKSSLNGLVRSLVDDDTIEELFKQLDWLVDQTTPQAMYYFSNNNHS